MASSTIATPLASYISIFRHRSQRSALHIYISSHRPSPSVTSTTTWRVFERASVNNSPYLPPPDMNRQDCESIGPRENGLRGQVPYTRRVRTSYLRCVLMCSSFPVLSVFHSRRLFAEAVLAIGCTCKVSISPGDSVTISALTFFVFVERHDNLR